MDLGTGVLPRAPGSVWFLEQGKLVTRAPMCSRCALTGPYISYNGYIMAHDLTQKIWHSVLRRPFRSAMPIDQHPDGACEVVLLHGLGGTSDIWARVARDLDTERFHVMAFDLLGFGESPKPQWAGYTVDDHARAVISAITRNRRRRAPVILAGHSMGGLVAVRVAKLRPDLVSHLILSQMPLYAGLPHWQYNLRHHFYFWLYDYLIGLGPKLGHAGIRRNILRLTGITLSENTAIPFVRSLKRTIMEQTTLADMRGLHMPIDVIYGALDPLVIRSGRGTVFADMPALRTYTVADSHLVSVNAARVITAQVVRADGLRRTARGDGAYSFLRTPGATSWRPPATS